MTDNATEQRIDGGTPNGGTYAIAQFFDASRKPAPKARARLVEITEYSAQDKAIFTTYGRLKNG